jgi:hypothetical protein
MRVLIPVVAILLGASALWSCGDDHDDSPASQCTGLVITGCDRAVSCLVSLGVLTRSQYQDISNQCERLATAAIPCEYATGVTDDYTQCISDVAATPCAFWEALDAEEFVLTLPPSCTDVVLVER